MEKTENATIINGIILTESAIGFLQSLQESDNDYHKEVSEKISLTISELITALDFYGGEPSSFLLGLIIYLNDFNKSFSHLMKP